MVTIIDYQERWPAEFRQLAADLKQVLSDLALRIDHIGSTSVPGLAAKDIIDIQISVAALSEDVKTQLKDHGYIHVEEIVCDHRPPDCTGPDSDWDKMFFRPPAGTRLANIHIRVLGAPNQRYPLLFRDYLRTHPATARAYAELKRRLAQNLADPAMYPEVKDPAVDLIYFAAEDWARQIDWKPED